MILPLKTQTHTGILSLFKRKGQQIGSRIAASSSLEKTSEKQSEATISKLKLVRRIVMSFVAGREGLE